MLRFVLLRHECPPSYEKPSHWDLMLEQGDSLATWELQKLPASWARLFETELAATSDSVPAIRLPDHRLAYLEFEGPLSGDRGEVHRCDGGAYEILSEQNDTLSVRLSGAILKGEAKLSCSSGHWQLQQLTEPSV